MADFINSVSKADFFNSYTSKYNIVVARVNSFIQNFGESTGFQASRHSLIFNGISSCQAKMAISKHKQVKPGQTDSLCTELCAKLN